MASDGGEEDWLDLLSNIEFASPEQVLSEQDFPVAEPLNDGSDRPSVSGNEDNNNAQAPDQQNAQTAVATPHEQDNPKETLKSLPRLDLNLRKTIYFVKNFESLRCGGQVDRRTYEALESQKFKPTSVPFCVLRIGNYQVRPQYQSHLIAKWYYTKKRLNWEILECGLKKKIEINWSDISAIRVGYGGDKETLEIELFKQPQFYCETEVRAKRHTSWKPSSDFTDGQASAYRRHYLEFPRGKLKRNMEPLFFLDSRLRELSKGPFPSSESPFFVGYAIGVPQSSTPLINPEPVQLRHHLHHQLPPNHSSNSTFSADDELMIREYERQLANNQMSSIENSLASQISDYDFAPPLSLPKSGAIFNGQFMEHPPGEQIVAPSNYVSDNATMGTSHGHKAYDHNSNSSNLMMTSTDPSYTGAGMNVAHHAPMWKDQTIFSQDARHYSGLISSSNAPAMDVPSSSRDYAVRYYHEGRGPYAGYENNSEPCLNVINAHHGHADDRLIYAELLSNHGPDHQHHG